ncbi:MAG TPA: amidohydrolase family protein [Acidimicrobiales bacterium]|nr:amidohydrolase family protein [Acidimicrobiales bacterium]
MAEHFELIVRAGMLVDGTGNPRRRADVGVRQGRIAAVGRLDGAGAEEEIDADGLVVAPGIIDPHTHYDPQITWDPYATASCFHGVTTVLAGNCGFSVAPVQPDDRAFFAGLFAKVEGMEPEALDGIRWEFSTFPQFLASRPGNLGVNLACYVGHCNLRRWVMGPEGSIRAATPAEVTEMGRILVEAMEAGAAGLSSTHAPTHNDGQNHPVPSRLSGLDELVALAGAVGSTHRGSITYLPRSAVGGLDRADMELLVELGRVSGLPVIIQGLGGRNKVDAPGAGWDVALDFLERARTAGAAVYSLLLARPFDRPFTLAEGTTLYEGVPAWDRVVAPGVADRHRLLRDPAVRGAMRDAVEHPNRKAEQGSTLPPPHWDVLFVGSVAHPELDRYVGRSVLDIAKEQGVAPADAMLDLALDDDLRTQFRWITETDEWMEAVREAQHNPHMIIGTSDGGAHLGRDDGSDYSTYFLRRWVLDLGEWTLERGIRQLTSVPAAILGFRHRGEVRTGNWADLMVFDPHHIRRPGRKELVPDLPGGTGRFQAYPNGIHATIVNGEPIVIDGTLTGRRPGQVVSPA